MKTDERTKDIDEEKRQKIAEILLDFRYEMLHLEAFKDKISGDVFTVDFNDIMKRAIAGIEAL